jgi:hypothetical protein
MPLLALVPDWPSILAEGLGAADREERRRSVNSA